MKLAKIKEEKMPQEKEDKTVTIYFNGRPKEVTKNQILTYESIITIAFENPQTGDSIQYTIMYSRGHGGSHDYLEKGQSVKAKEGMEFSVTCTNRS
jgi:hypothetical protein